MAFDVEAAKADGYTDQEIQQYLATKNQPLAADQPRDRSEEQLGTAVAAMPAAGELAKDVGILGAELYAGKKLIYDPIMKRFGTPTAPVAPPVSPAQQTFNALKASDAENMARAAKQPAQQISRAQQIVQQLALDKVLKSAGVPAAIAAGGAAATGLAGGQMRAMTPQQRQGFYSNPMLGAMGGDAALGAAIMNQGQ